MIKTLIELEDKREENIETLEKQWRKKVTVENVQDLYEEFQMKNS
jgi:hypothetical protein